MRVDGQEGVKIVRGEWQGNFPQLPAITLTPEQNR